MSEELKPCPFCGGPAKEPIHYNGAQETGCAGSHECPGTDILVPLKAWNIRSNTLIEEQAARIAELEKERDVAWESREWHRVSMEGQTENLIASQARLSEAVKVLEKTTTVLDALLNESPGTLSCGMRCQLETTQEDEEDYMIAYGHAEFFRDQAKAFIATLGEEK